MHKKIGNTDLALMNFSRAMDLDPKGANNHIKDVIDKQYANEEDDVMPMHEDKNESGSQLSPNDRQSHNGSSTSLEADDDDFLIEESI